MIYLRVSTLDLYRKVVSTDWAEEEELIDAVKRGQEGGPENWMMECGTAWHRALAGEVADDLDRLEDESLVGFGGWWFKLGDVHASQVARGHGLHELTSIARRDVGGRTVTLKGTADWMNGLTIRDAKTKFADCDPRDYEPSLQWRCYLSLFDAACFVYDLYAMKAYDDNCCELKDVTSFRLWRYPGMEDDIDDWIGRFLKWAAGKNLMKFLDRSVARVA